MGSSVKISVGTTNLRPMWVVATILLVGALVMLVGGILMQLVYHVFLAPLWVGVFAGILLSIPLEIWDFSNPDVIIRAITLKDRLLMVCFGLVIGVGAILLYALNLFVPVLHWGIKSFFVPGIVVGGLLFGIGTAIAGYFPGTIWIALGQGRRDAVYAVIGGLLGALTWSLIFGQARYFFWDTLNFGPITWPTVFGLTSKLDEFLVAIVFGALMISMWLFVPRRQGGRACVLHLTGKTKEVTPLEDEISEFKEDYPKIPDYV
ncbi:MAG: YeeE/YedE family protein, partial [Vulcanisaeta sp.]|nr:YeeE/YedE family protein [Vulcanisaeta sp.]